MYRIKRQCVLCHHSMASDMDRTDAKRCGSRKRFDWRAEHHGRRQLHHAPVARESRGVPQIIEINKPDVRTGRMVLLTWSTQRYQGVHGQQADQTGYKSPDKSSRTIDVLTGPPKRRIRRASCPTACSSLTRAGEPKDGSIAVRGVAVF